MLESVQEILKPVARQVVLISYDYEIILAARKLNWPKVGVVLKQWTDLFTELVKDIQSNFVFVSYKIIPKHINKASCAVLREAKLVAFEVGTPELCQKLLDQGVDMLETFELQKLNKKLGYRLPEP